MSSPFVTRVADKSPLRRFFGIFAAVVGLALVSLGATFAYLAIQEPDYLREQAKEWTHRILKIPELKAMRVEHAALLDDDIWLPPTPEGKRYLNGEKLVAMLYARKFALLDEKFEVLQAAFERDPRQEVAIVDAFAVLSTDALETGELIEAWLAERPDSFAAKLARANHRYEVAWYLRGGAYVAETAPLRMWLMRQQLRPAVSDAQEVLQARPKLLPALHTLLDIAITRGDHASVASLRSQAFALAPHADSTFRISLRAALPRWGGSYGQIAALAQLAQPYAVDNPGLRILAVYEDIDRASLLERDDHYAEALALYDRALAQAEHWDALADRAACHRRMKNYEAALRDIDRAIALRPQVPALHSERYTIHAQLRNYRKAAEDLLITARLSPTEPAEGRRAWAIQGLLYEGGQLEKKGDFRAAVELYELGQQLDPADRQMGGQASRARLRAAPTSAEEIEQLVRAANANERDFEIRLALDSALFQAKKFHDILPHWDRYISAVPQDARAYYERAGVAHYAKLPKQAADDSFKACELGYERACTRLGLYGLKRPELTKPKLAAL